MRLFLVSFPVVRTTYESMTVEATDEDEATSIVFDKVKYRGDEPIDASDLEVEELED